MEITRVRKIDAGGKYALRSSDRFDTGEVLDTRLPEGENVIGHLTMEDDGTAVVKPTPAVQEHHKPLKATSWSWERAARRFILKLEGLL